MHFYSFIIKNTTNVNLLNVISLSFIKSSLNFCYIVDMVNVVFIPICLILFTVISYLYTKNNQKHLTQVYYNTICLLHSIFKVNSQSINTHSIKCFYKFVLEYLFYKNIYAFY